VGGTQSFSHQEDGKTRRARAAANPCLCQRPQEGGEEGQDCGEAAADTLSYRNPLVQFDARSPKLEVTIGSSSIHFSVEKIGTHPLYLNSAARKVWSDGFSARRGSLSTQIFLSRSDMGFVPRIWSMRQPLLAARDDGKR